MLVIKNAKIVTPPTILDCAEVFVENGRIVAVSAPNQHAIAEDAEIIDATGQILVPGFIDMQFNGAFGHDFAREPEAIWKVAKGLPQWGVTSFLPTVVTSPLTTVQKAQEVLGIRPYQYESAEPLGLHIEGPFINPQKKGAHNPNYIQLPRLEAVADWSPETHVRLVTLAPEQKGALPVISALAERNVIVSAGHSMATFDEAKAGFDAGIRYGTHLFNAMPPLHHREPSLPGALLDDSRVVIGIIPDGVHVHPNLINVVWQVAGDRLNVVTDAMAALGMPAGEYDLGDFTVEVDETTCRLPDGTLAGSILSLDTAVRNLIAFTNCTLAEALSTVTTIPAQMLGLEQQKGVIAPDFDADLVLLDEQLNVQTTIVHGKVVFNSERVDV